MERLPYIPLKRMSFPLEVNVEALEALLPQLQKAEDKLLQKKETLKQQEAERKKMGPPDDMTVLLLKEVLDDLNITYRSSEKKADLIEKVRNARATLHDASRLQLHKSRLFLFSVLEYWNSV